MAKIPIIVGLEIGTAKVCVVVAEAAPGDETRILCVGQADSRGVRKGEIVDFDAAHESLRDAIADAESKSDVSIRSAYVGISGGHVTSLNNRGVVHLPGDRNEISEDDVAEVKLRAGEVSIPTTNAFLHNFIQQYRVDGRDGVMNPVGMLGHKIEADYHIVHGVRNRIQNTIRLVREVPLEVDDVVFSGLASALAVLDREQRERGALVIDIGGGTTDYVIYRDGAVHDSGCIAVGGDHITNDISMGLRIPMGRAERIKIDEGGAVLGTCMPDERIHLRGEPGFAARDIEREMLHQVIHYRLREIFELLKKRFDDDRHLDYIGAGVVLTGGSSQMPGIQHLAEDVFGVPVQPAQAPPVTGLTSALSNPQISTAIGLVEYARLVQEEHPAEGWWQRVRHRFARALGSR